jgi:hypothetical protein
MRYSTGRKYVYYFRKHKINDVSGKRHEIDSTEVLLDNHADISILHPYLIPDMRDSRKTIRVKGVGGLQMMVKENGIL